MMSSIEIASNKAAFQDRPPKQRVQGIFLVVLAIGVYYSHAVDRELKDIASLEGPRKL
jgi:hypothetical protein